MRRGPVLAVVEQVAARLIIPVIAAIGGIWIALDKPALRHEIGTTAIVYDRGADPFVGGEKRRRRIQVVDSGLENGSGLAFDERNKTLYFNDAWDAIGHCPVIFRGSAVTCEKPKEQKSLARLPVNTEICPDDRCEPVEHGGAVIVGGDLVIADTHKHQVLAWDPIGRKPVQDRWRFTGLGRVRDVAVIANDRIVVAEAAPAQPAGLRDFGGARRGALYELSADGRRTDIGIQVTEPLGVAHSPAGPDSPAQLYVADLADRVITWRRFQSIDGTWLDHGVVWSQALGAGATPPSLQSIRVARKGGKEALFVATPDGLSVLDPRGVLLARFVLNAPVSGLAWGSDSNLFLTIGRRLCVLKTDADAYLPPPATAIPPPLSPRQDNQ